MRQWWRLWSGHVVLALAIGVFGYGGLLLRDAARATTAGQTWAYLGAGVLVLIVGAALGVLTAWLYRTPSERYYIRKAYGPAGGDE